MIAVTGATGHLGRSTLQALSKRTPADKIVAIARDPARAQDLAKQGFLVRKADYNDPPSLLAALHGVDKLLLISSSEVGARLQQHRHVVAAAAQSGVSLLAYTSLLHCDTAQTMLAQEHRDTEACIRASSVPYIILRNGWYLENYSNPVASALQSGTLLGCANEGRISAASRADFAAAAAVVLTEPGHMNQTYELAGDQAFSLRELAGAISRHSGKAVRYAALSQEAYIEALKAHHLPDGVARLLADSDCGISRGELQEDSRKLSRIIGRPTTSIDRLLADLTNKAQP
jgi:NAD(P)H dehydrogenase (quinone)